MPKKILIVSSSFEEISLLTASKDWPTGIKTTDASHYPLGIAYLHSYLEACGHQVESLFLNNYNYQVCFDIVVETIKKFSPEIIGFQILTTNRVSAYKLIEHIHENYPKIKLLIGGVHATIMHQQLLEKYPYLIAVLGEGEITFTELTNKLFDQNCNLTKIDGIAFNLNGSVIKTNPRKLIENLDELPRAKHEIFFNNKRSFGCIMTARGCPFNCSFCCLDILSQRRVRMRSVENIIEEIEWMIARFPEMTEIWIHDDTFFINNQRVIKLCDEIIKRKINIKFTCSGRMKPLNEEVIKKLEQANFKKVLLGLESGDESILKSCHKAITQQDVINAFRLFAGSKIRLTAFLIVGLPGETLETIKETAKFVKKLQKIKYTYYGDCSILTIYPGTEIYEIAKAGGIINDDYWLTNKPTPLFTLENSQEQLLRFKEILLNYISVERFLTPAGFIRQLDMIPYNLKYIMQNKNSLVPIISKTLKTIMPNSVFRFIKKQYNLAKNKPA